METDYSSWNTTLEEVLDLRDEKLAGAEISVLAIILILALTGNSFVLVALWQQMKFRSTSRMYLFMMHLSIADLMVALFSIFPQMLWKITFRFRGGDFLCRAVKYMQIMVLYLSTYILVMMAIDRYRAVCWTANLYWNSLKLAKAMVVAAWVISLLFAIPQPIIFQVTELWHLPGVYDCWVHFQEPWGGKVYVTWFVLSVFILPLIILSFCYGVICYKIWSYNPERPKTPHGNKNSGLLQDAALVSKGSTGALPPDGVAYNAATKRKTVRLRRTGKNHISNAKLKTVKLTLIVIICFFVCWSPFCITQLVMVYNPPEKAGPVETILALLACLNSCTNPWIYLAFSGSLLNHLRVCIGIGTRRFRDNDSIGDEEPEPKPCKPRENHHYNHFDQPHASAKLASTKSEVM